MKTKQKEYQRLDELRKRRDEAVKRFERWKSVNPDETNPVYRQLFNRAERAKEEFSEAYLGWK